MQKQMTPQFPFSAVWSIIGAVYQLLNIQHRLSLPF